MVADEVKQLGRYVLRYKIAQGGMASVYLAQLAGPREFTKWVAVKVIHPHMAEDRRFVAMFLDEARIASRIEHPNVCQMLDFGEEDGLLFLVLEYLHGESLQTVIHEGWSADGVPPWLAARVVADAARGLHAAHELRGPDGKALRIVHRDVSPQNVMVLYDGVAKIMDFGVAHAEGRLAETKTGELKGKLRYMAPEQLTGGQVDRRTDIWGMGVVLWETTTGRRLFAGSNEGEVVVRVMRDAVPRPSELVAGYPAALERVVMAALERDPSRRIASALALADGLEAYLAQLREPATAGRVSHWMKTVLAENRARREVLLRDQPVAGPDQSVPEISLETGSTIRRDLGTTPGQRAARNRRMMLGGAAVVAVGLVVGVLAGLYSGEADPAVPAAGLAAADPTVSVGPLTVTQPAPPERALAPEVADAGAAVPDATVESPPREELVVRTARHARRRPPAAPGTLNLLAVPAAEVYWRGRSLGNTPLLDVSLPAGTQTLTLHAVHGDQRATVRVVIHPGRLTRRSVSLD